MTAQELPNLFKTLPNKWKLFIKNELDYDNLTQFSNLSNFICSEISNKPEKIFPEKSKIFSAFDLTPEKIKCVIIGQDPYHGKNQANGLAFSVSKKTSIPPSLSNIFKELNKDLGFTYPNSGDLTPWKKNGVLLLNSVLTVEEKKPTSHTNKGWETFTNLIIKCLSNQLNNLVFILWGKKAKDKAFFIDDTKHLIIYSTHPSPYSVFGTAGSDVQSFFGSKPFSRTNDYLKNHGIEEINWELPPEDREENK